jgi:hypothetical protein
MERHSKAKVNIPKSFSLDHWYPYAQRLKKDLQELSAKTGIQDWKSPEGQKMLENIMIVKMQAEEIEESIRKEHEGTFLYPLNLNVRSYHRAQAEY